MTYELNCKDSDVLQLLQNYQRVVCVSGLLFEGFSQETAFCQDFCNTGPRVFRVFPVFNPACKPTVNPTGFHNEQVDIHAILKLVRSRGRKVTGYMTCLEGCKPLEHT